MSKAKDSYASVWDAITDTAEEAANLRVRSELMGQLAAIVQSRGWTQAEAAARCGVTQPRMNDLLRGRLSRFSLDALVNVAAALGQRVHVGLDAPARSGRGAKKTVSSAAVSRRPQRDQVAAKSRTSTSREAFRATPSRASIARNLRGAKPSNKLSPNEIMTLMRGKP